MALYRVSNSNLQRTTRREQRRIYGATRKSAVLPRGWLNFKVNTGTLTPSVFVWPLSFFRIWL